METKQIDAKTFWRALAARATGGGVATARGPADPPTMLVSVDKRTAALAAVLHGKHFALNFLPHGDRALADTFGGRSETRGAARFAPERWGTLTTGAPI